MKQTTQIEEIVKLKDASATNTLIIKLFTGNLNPLPKIKCKIHHQWYRQNLLKPRKLKSGEVILEILFKKQTFQNIH